MELTDDELEAKIASGIQWLTSRDPDGSFYFWYTSGLTESSRLPAQPEDRRAAWQAWVKQCRIFWKLMDELDRRGLRGAQAEG